MPKDVFYFPHDYHARGNDKILELLVKYQWQGYGLYWAIVEMLYEDSEHRLPLKRIEAIAFNLSVPFQTLYEFITNVCDIGLFSRDDDSFWCNAVLERLEIRKKKSESARKSVMYRWGKEKGDNGLYERNTKKQKRNTIKGKERKGKERENKEFSPLSRYDEIQKVLTDFMATDQYRGKEKDPVRLNIKFFEILNTLNGTAPKNLSQLRSKAIAFAINEK